MVRRFLTGVLAFVTAFSLIVPGVSVCAQNMEEVEVAQLEKDYASEITSGEYIYTMYSANTVKLVGFTQSYDRAAIVIPSTIDGYKVVAIGSNVLKNRTSTTSVTIPATVTDIAENGIKGNYIAEIIVEEGNKAFKTTDGKNMLLTADGKRLICYAPGCTYTVCDVPAGVESIDSYAFYNARNLEKITLPTGIKEIKSYTFMSTSITDFAIPEGVTTIAENAFYMCRDLESISFPSTITDIKGHPFLYCSKLKSIDIASGANCVVKNNLLLCDNETVAIAYLIGNSMTTCTIPESVIKISKGALRSSDIKELIIPGNVETIGWEVLRDSNVEKVVLEDGVKTISYYMFQDCKNLKELSVPISVTNIGYAAFSNCTALTDIYYVGTESGWDNINIDSNNDDELANITVHYQGVEAPVISAPVISAELVDSGVFLSWPSVAKATSYKIYRADSVDGVKKLIDTVTDRSYVDASVEQGKSYYYYGVACGSTQSDYSDAVEIYVVSDLEKFVSRLYTIALKRDVDPTGYADWVGGLESGKYDGAAVGRGIFLSPEFVGYNLSDDEFLDRLYHTFFDREPDSSGLTNWHNHLDAGYSREFVLSNFVNSEEFMNLCNNFGIERGVLLEDGNAVPVGLSKFVRRLYGKVLERDPDWQGYTDWIIKLATGRNDAATVAGAFFGSQEFIGKNTSDVVYVVKLYETFFDRSPDEGGFKDWVAKLESGMTRSEVINGFCGSQEFLSLLTSFGL